MSAAVDSCFDRTILLLTTAFHPLLPLLLLPQNGTVASNSALIAGLIAAANSNSIPAETDVIIAPTFIHIAHAQQQLAAINNSSSSKHNISVSAQNCSLYAQGAHTGEITADQLADAGVHWVILGHSERRQEQQEADAVVAAKVKAALAAGLSVIACCGETLAQREANEQVSVVTRQLEAIRAAIGNSSSSWSRVVIAYEPVWAIGTGRNASPQQAQDMHAAIRAYISSSVSAAAAAAISIQYGGSVKSSNARELMQQPDIDGFLVGGASLKAEEFMAIVYSTKGVTKHTASKL